MANSVLDWLDASVDRFPDRVAFRDVHDRIDHESDCKQNGNQH